MKPYLRAIRYNQKAGSMQRQESLAGLSILIEMCCFAIVL